MPPRLPKRHRHGIEYFLFRIFRALVRRLPPRAAAALMSGAALAAHQVLGWRKAQTRARIAQVFPHLPLSQRERIRRNAVRNLGRNFAEILRADLLDPARESEHIDIENAIASLLEARKHRRGVLLVLSHSGNWDLVGTIAARRDIPFCFIAREQNNSLIYQDLQQTREHTGGKVLDRDDPKLIRKLLRFLREENGVVVILVDTRARGQGESFTFLGQPCRLSNGLGLLAAKSGAEVLPVAIHRDSPQHHTCIPLPPRRLQPSDKKPARHHLLQSCLDDLGADILAHPESYFWFNKRWVLEPPAAR